MKKDIIAIFDFDNTIINCYSGSRFISFCNKKSLSLISIIIYLLLFINKYFEFLTVVQKKRLSIYRLKGISSKKLGFLSELFVTEILLKNEKNNVLSVIENHKNMDHKLILLSGAYQIYLEEYGKIRGFDIIIGSKLHIKKNKTTGRLLGKENIGIEKVKNLIKAIDLSQCDLTNSYAYADDCSDKYVMELVGNKYLVEGEKIKEWSEKD